jgi:hypothetical protein
MNNTFSELENVIKKINAYGHYLSLDQLNILKGCLQNLKYLLILEREGY